MSAITWTDVVAHAAALSTFNATAQTDVLAYVNGLLKVSEFGGEAGATLRLARIYLAAHFATLEAAAAASASAAGPVTSETGGGLSRSYGSTVSDSSRLGDTAWGRAYQAIVRTSAARAFVVL